jgi:beta-N-acetylhexosaminidase
MNTWIENTLQNLSTEDRVGQMMMVGFHGLEAPPHVLEWLADGRAGSVVLFSRNVASPQQLSELTASLREAAPLPIMICIDQEGGTVARMRAASGFAESPGNMALGASTQADALAHAEEMARIMALEMRAAGIDWVLAPCLDVLSNPHNPVVGVRSYGSNPDRVAALGAAQVRGFQAGGVAACAKHFPGHGNTRIDSHVDLPTIQASLEHLQQVDFRPFAAAIDAGTATVMIAHIIFTAIDPEYPATFSRAIQQDLLRGQLGFEGVITTDCMEMKAVADRYGAGESTVLAALAGTDSIVHSHTRARQEAAYEAMLKAARSGRLQAERIEQSVRRLLAQKYRYAVEARHSVPALQEINSETHRAAGLDAARQGMVMVRGQQPKATRRVMTLIEFSFVRASEAEEFVTGNTQLQEDLRAHFPGMQSVLIPSVGPSNNDIEKARQLARRADLLVVATRSAHHVTTQCQLAAELLDAAPNDSVLLALRNPWDAAALPNAKNVLATLGDSRPSLQAAAEALADKFKPAGALPVPLE